MSPRREVNCLSRIPQRKSIVCCARSIQMRWRTCATYSAKNWIAFMRVNGEWLICEDGVIRPTVTGVVRTPDGQVFEVPFLLDAGADRTVFSADFLSLLIPLRSREAEQIHLAGV